MSEKKQSLPGLSFSYETNRLILKISSPGFTGGVLDFLSRNRSDFEKYEPAVPENYYTADFQQTILKYEQQLACKLSYIRFYVFCRDDPSYIIGTVCLHNITRQAFSCCEIGYKFDSAYRRRGYAKEALSLALSVAFDRLNLHRVFARCLPENVPSRKLLLSLGFCEEGLEHECIRIQGVWRDHVRYALIHHDSSSV